MARVGRDRIRHKRLPKGWAPAKSGAVYFRPTNDEDRAIVKAITGGPMSLLLGPSIAAAYESPTWLKIVADRRARDAADLVTPGTVAELCALARRPGDFLDSIEHPKTRSERERHLRELETEFGAKRYAKNVYEASRDTVGQFFRAMDAQRHLFRFKGKRGHVSANRRVRSWELLFQWARAPWGLTEYNPCEGIMEHKEKPRRVVPQDPVHLQALPRALAAGALHGGHDPLLRPAEDRTPPPRRHRRQGRRHPPHPRQGRRGAAHHHQVGPAQRAHVGARAALARGG
jgi:hypothetical protein